jgi:hypothetical protein
VDGRLISGCAVTIFFAIILLLPISDREIWMAAGVPAITPNFADLRVITSGWECTNRGYDVLAKNPCDQGHRRMNYPRVWLAPAVLRATQGATTALAVLFAVLFFASALVFVGRLAWFEGLLLGAVLLSPPVLLVIERGNTDALIYTLLVVSIMLWRSQNRAWRAFGRGMVLVAAIAKLYPILALVAFFRRGARSATVAGGMIGVAFATYVVLTFRDLVLVLRGTPQATDYSYGARVLQTAVHRTLESRGAGAASISGFLLPAALTVIGATLALYTATTLSRQLVDVLQDDSHLDGFLVGAAIYTGTFLIGSNYNYRLVFVTLTIPCLLHAVRNRERIASWALAAIIAMLFLARFQGQADPIWFVAAQLLEWGLFGLFLGTLWTWLDLRSLLDRSEPVRFVPGRAKVRRLAP